jgi:WD40 repeat protein
MMMMTDDGDDEQQAHYNAPKVTHLHSLHFDAPVEAMVFAKSKFICHVRNSPHLYVIDDTSWELQNVDIHEGYNGGFENHVSFCVLDLQLSPNGQFLACATDAHRHIILDCNDYRIVRNLYGHQADSYSSPVIAWSTNSQYLYSNHQHEAKIVVYELASGKIVSELMVAASQQQHHTRPIKALYSSKSSNTLVSISWDRSTIIWFTE